MIFQLVKSRNIGTKMLVNIKDAMSTNIKISLPFYTSFLIVLLIEILTVQRQVGSITILKFQIMYYF